MDDELISRDELTSMLFSIADMRLDLRAVRELLEEQEDGEDSEDDA